MSEPDNQSDSFGGTNLMEQLQQEHALAQIISSMPSNVDGGPDITVAAPIRAKWAHRLWQQGVRVHESLATHKVVVHDSGIAGPHSPRSFEKIDKDKLMSMLQKQNPALYKKIKEAQDSRHGGDKAVNNLLNEVLKRLPEEWLEKLGPDLAAKVDDFAAENMPPEEEESPDDSA